MTDLSNPAVYLSWLIFLPAIAALVITFLPVSGEALKRISLGATIVVAVMSLMMLGSGNHAAFQAHVDRMQNQFAYNWIPSFKIQYLMGTDGISFPLIVLTACLSVLAMAASWPIKKYERAYCVLFLLLETGMLGVFCALDFFLFYVFWEVMLLPMYFLIGIWGGPRKEYAAIKFFLYTLLGSVLMLIAILMLYFNSDLTDPQLRPYLDKAYLAQGDRAHAEEGMAAREKIGAAGDKSALPPPVHTFNILALQQLGQHTDQFTKPVWWNHSLAWWSFV